jgi:hypothetical protein
MPVGRSQQDTPKEENAMKTKMMLMTAFVISITGCAGEVCDDEFDCVDDEVMLPEEMAEAEGADAQGTGDLAYITLRVDFA